MKFLLSLLGLTIIIYETVWGTGNPEILMIGSSLLGLPAVMYAGEIPEAEEVEVALPPEPEVEKVTVTRDTDLRIAQAPPEYEIERLVRKDMERLNLR